MRFVNTSSYSFDMITIMGVSQSLGDMSIQYRYSSVMPEFCSISSLGPRLLYAASYLCRFLVLHLATITRRRSTTFPFELPWLDWPLVPGPTLRTHICSFGIEMRDLLFARKPLLPFAPGRCCLGFDLQNPPSGICPLLDRCDLPPGDKRIKSNIEFIDKTCIKVTFAYDRYVPFVISFLVVIAIS
jgi:hypothetical protein